MSDSRNSFGGKTRNAEYTPISEDEQEVVARLIESNDLMLRIVDPETQVEWGVVNQFDRVTFGDQQIHFYFTLTFSKPAVWQPISALDLELRTRAGLLLFKDRKPTLVDYQPLLVKEGMFVQMAWDIALRQMDPMVVKAIKPGATGLTSREGNMKLSGKQQNLLKLIRAGERKLRAAEALLLRKLRLEPIRK